MSIIKTAIGVALGVGIVYFGSGVYEFVQKEYAINDCLKSFPPNAYVTGFMAAPCMAAHGYKPDTSGSSLDWKRVQTVKVE